MALILNELLDTTEKDLPDLNICSNSSSLNDNNCVDCSCP